MIVLGGGLSNFDYLYEALPKALPPHLMRTAKVPPIKKSETRRFWWCAWRGSVVFNQIIQQTSGAYSNNMPFVFEKYLEYSKFIRFFLFCFSFL